MLAVDLKKAIYRLKYRGMKELDVFFSRVVQNLERLTTEEQALLERLIHESEAHLYAWVLGHSPHPPHYTALLEKILTFR